MGAHVLLATGQEVLRMGLESLLLEDPAIRAVTSARSGAEALEALEHADIDVAVLGAGPARCRDVDLIGSAEESRVRRRWVALVDKRGRSDIECAMGAGAAGIVSTASSVHTLTEAIRWVHEGRCYVSADVTSSLINGSPNPGMTGGQATALTARERAVLRLVAEDCTSREIADRLGISIRTVDTHRARLMEKLGLHKTAALVRFAVREGFVAA